MRTLRLCPFVLLAALALPGTAGATVGQAGEYVVLYAKGATAADARQAVQAAGGTIVHENAAVGLATVRADGAGFAERADREPALVGAAADRSIGRAPADRVKGDAVEQAAGEVRASQASRGSGPEPLSALQWNLRMIHATPDGSYAVERGRRAVRVGVIDTGVDGRHPDIAPNFRADLSRNFTTDIPAIDGPCEEEPDRSCEDANDVDEDGHGTHVASTIGSPLNGVGIGGVAPNVSLVNLRAGQDSGFFFIGPTVDALTYAGNHGIDVVNMSFFVDPWLFNCPNNPADSPGEQFQQRLIIAAVQRAVDYARAHGVTVVSALGNENTDLGNPTVDTTSPDYPEGSERERAIDNSCIDVPAETDGVISVSAVGPSGRKAYYSDYGLEQNDVAAPGGDRRDFFGTPQYATPETRILAAYPKNVGLIEDRDGDGTPDIDPVTGNPTTPLVVREGDAYYQWIQGTSMASPHAAAVAALIVARYGHRDRAHRGLTLDPDRVEQILRSTATDTPCPEPRTFMYPDPDLGPEFTAVCEGTPERNGFYGDGIVDALAAVGGPGGGDD
jgi:subtilisin family serine protease